MISFDTNLLLYALNQDCTEYSAARAFFDSLLHSVIRAWRSSPRAMRVTSRPSVSPESGIHCSP